MNINKANIANAIHSVAKDHVVAVANDIYDESREQYQSTLNEGVGLYEDSPEFVKVVTDANGRILYAVKADGDFYFGAGIPSQIQEISSSDYDTLDAKIDAVDAALKDLLQAEKERAEAAEQNLVDTKVDKEEGKSLIPTQYIQEIEDNPEFVKVVLDSEDKILYGIKANGDFMFGCGVPSQIQEKLDELGIYKDNPEYVRVYLDKEGKILWGIKSDGSIYYGAGIPTQIKKYIDERLQDLSLDEYEAIVNFIDGLEDGTKSLLDLLNEKVDKVNGKSLIDVEYAESVSQIENPEFLEVITDSEDKVLEGIQQDGTKVIGGNLNVGGSANINGDIRVLGNIELSGVSYKVIENSEYLEAKIDDEGKLIEGINRNGEKIFGVIPPQIKQYIDENMPTGGSGVQSIEYDDATGDMYATYDDESGVTDVYMEPNGDIYVESEE